MPRLTYASKLRNITVNRDEDLVAHNWYRFLLWALGVGGAAFLMWFVFVGYQWGYHANPCTPPCTQSAGQQLPAIPSKVQVDTSGLEKAAADLKLATDKLATHTAVPPVATPRRLAVPSPVTFPSYTLTVETPGVERATNRLTDAIRDSMTLPLATTQPAAQSAPVSTDNDSAAARARRLEEWSRQP